MTYKIGETQETKIEETQLYRFVYDNLFELECDVWNYGYIWGKKGCQDVTFGAKLFVNPVTLKLQFFYFAETDDEKFVTLDFDNAVSRIVYALMQ